MPFMIMMYLNIQNILKLILNIKLFGNQLLEYLCLEWKIIYLD